ncbi:MAG: NAD(P)/FAD-dependent oxidoreductase [Candidatus Aminicenantes bacterium]|nr:NAD(P)/FAD-dependent oxidoreductase [Candidatus Aminicenantes bacterium]
MTRVGIVGNGLAGVIAAKTLREAGFDGEIEIFAREKYPYYPRPNLIEHLAGRLPAERLFAFPESWYVERRIRVRLATPSRRILSEPLAVELSSGQRVEFDRLLLADGASCFIPPMAGADKKGVFSLRTWDDALSILEDLQDHRRVAVLGGGLLGLEIARALAARGASVRVVEFFDRLLPRQLDPQGAAVLRTQIEKSGIAVRLGIATEEIFGSDRVAGLKFKDGSAMDADMAIVAAGVRPNLDLAKDAGLAVERGVVVDDRLRTNRPGIFAAGDNTQHQGRLYGIIPAAFEQARAAAFNILDRDKAYRGTLPSNTLKVAGLSLTSVGEAVPEGGGVEEIRKEDPERGLYKKIVLKEGRLVGAIWMGTREGAPQVSKAVSQKADVSRWKKEILEDGFDFARLG